MQISISIISIISAHLSIYFIYISAYLSIISAHLPIYIIYISAYLSIISAHLSIYFIYISAYLSIISAYLSIISAHLPIYFIHISAYLSIISAYLSTGWQRLIGSPKLHVIFHKRATKYRSLLRKMTYNDKGSYESSPPCICISACENMYLHGRTCICMCALEICVSNADMCCISALEIFEEKTSNTFIHHIRTSNSNIQYIE